MTRNLAVVLTVAVPAALAEAASVGRGNPKGTSP